jgi:hypothetical protein
MEMRYQIGLALSIIVVISGCATAPMDSDLQNFIFSNKSQTNNVTMVNAKSWGPVVENVDLKIKGDKLTASQKDLILFVMPSLSDKYNDGQKDFMIFIMNSIPETLDDNQKDFFTFIINSLD